MLSSPSTSTQTLRPPSLLAGLVVLAGSGAPRPALAWTEARPTSVATEVQLDRDGLATVSLRLGWRVSGGRLQRFELTELPPDLAVVDASATTASGAPVPLATQSPAPGRLEVHLGDEAGAGVRRGTVDVLLRYTTSMRAGGQIHRAGPDAVVEFSTLPWERGLETTELRLSLPNGPRRAQWLSDDTPGVEASAVSELSRDVVRASRRHLPAATRWTVRVAADAAVFPWLHASATRGRSAQVTARRPWGRATATGLAAAVLAIAAARALRPRGAGPPTRRGAAVVAAMLAVAGVGLQFLCGLGVPWTLALGTASFAGGAIAYRSAWPSHAQPRRDPPIALVASVAVAAAAAVASSSVALAAFAVDLALLGWGLALPTRRGLSAA